MSEKVELKAPDGQEFSAYAATPAGEPLAALVVLQEIFGVNQHIRSVADSYAKDGFYARAPALFDRIERHVELGYEGSDLEKAKSFIPKLDLMSSLIDVDTAIQFAGSATGRKVGVVGYCYGGTLAWLAATRLTPAAAVGYYGGRTYQFSEEGLIEKAWRGRRS
jgi:carboxymethylenebutenolidase